MSKKIYLTVIYILIGLTAKAQFTRIINSNLPGKSQTPYTVGTNVFQFENALNYEKAENNSLTTTAANNNFKFRYGFWKEKLEAFFTNTIRYANISSINNNLFGVQEFALGAKYLVFQHIPDENNSVKKSWKKRNSFIRNGLIPDVGLSLQYNLPFISNDYKSINSYNNGNSISASVTTSNQVSRYTTINNQISFNSIFGNTSEFMYALSGTYALYKRLRPYAELRFHNFSTSSSNTNFKYYAALIGIPYAISTDLMVALHYEYNFEKNINANQFGVNVSYRINKHVDQWKDKKYRYENQIISYEDDLPVGSNEEPQPNVDIQYAEEQSFTLDSEARKKERLKAEKEALKQAKKDEKEAKKALKRAEKEAKKAEKQAKKDGKKANDKKIDDSLIQY